MKNYEVKIITPSTEEPEEKAPAPREVFRSVIGWVLAAVLVLIVPTAVLCGDPGKIIAITVAILGVAGVFTYVICTN